MAAIFNKPLGLPAYRQGSGTILFYYFSDVQEMLTLVAPAVDQWFVSMIQLI